MPELPSKEETITQAQEDANEGVYLNPHRVDAGGTEENRKVYNEAHTNQRAEILAEERRNNRPWWRPF